MAGLDLAPQTRWSTNQTRAQFRAIATLRWRIAKNQFRTKGGGGEMVGRIFMALLFTVFALGMMSFAGSMSFLALETGHANRIVFVLWGAFLLSQFLNIQLGQPGTVFDPTQLIRFPLRANTYVAIRLFFGLLSPANIIVALLSLSIATGITFADSSLWLYAFVAMLLFAITNALFSRMIFAWVDRWLSTRRSREVFTAFIFIFSLGIQYLNVTFNPGLNSNKHRQVPAQRMNAMLQHYHQVQTYLNPLPPQLITKAILARNIGVFAAYSLGCLAFAAVFYLVFAWRTRIEFRGENLSDAANGVTAKPTPKQSLAQTRVTAAPVAPTPGYQLPSTISAVLSKEILQMKRNTGLFFGLIAPIFFVFLFAGRIASRGNAAWIFPAALVYVMLGIAPMSYNAFGLEATGTQFYFLAPIRLRDVFLAKNLISFIIAAIDIGVALAVVAHVSVMPPLSILASTLLWAAATLLLTTTLGNRRSVTTPKKIETGRVASKQASQTSALLAFGILLGSAAIGGGFLLLSIYLGKQWFLLPLFAAFTAGAFFVYQWGQNTIDAFTLSRREHLLEELGKKA